MKRGGWLKRKTPLKAKTQIKRSTKRIPYRSKKNSRKIENVELRQEYRRFNQRCELWDLLTEANVDGWEKHKRAWVEACGIKKCLSDVSVHHIFHVGNRPDVWPNFISLSAAAHSFIHDKNPTDGTILALAVKKAKGELDTVELECVGVRVSGWLETHESQNAFVESVRLRLVRELAT